jgi:DNA-binding transcriptional ArsR family regulator
MRSFLTVCGILKSHCAGVVKAWKATEHKWRWNCPIGKCNNWYGILDYMNYKEKAELFNLLSNPIRLQILDILSKKDASLDELTETIGVRKPNTSQHLAILRYLRIVKTRREGIRTIYRLTNPNIKKVIEFTRGMK